MAHLREAASEWVVFVGESPTRRIGRFRAERPGACPDWTLGERTVEIIGRVNRLLRGWSGYFHYQNSSRVVGRLSRWVNERTRRWLWRKHACRRGLRKHYGDGVLYQRHRLWALPQTAGCPRMR